MVKEINGLGVNPGYAKRPEQKPGADTDNRADSAAENTANNADQVELSNQAQNLAALTEQVKQQPDANLARVEQIRAALDSGEYQIDSLILADKLLEQESLLGE